VPPPPSAAEAQPSTPKKKNWFRRHKILTAILALFVLILIIASVAGGSSNKNSNGSSGGSPTTPAQTPTTTPPSKPAKPKPSLTGPQQQAVESAQSYLSEGNGFSRTGLIKQLSSSFGEGFPKAVAVFAVDHLNVNWYQQAVDSAKGYKSEGNGFSCSGMIHQLSSSYGEPSPRRKLLTRRTRSACADPLLASTPARTPASLLLRRNLGRDHRPSG
jgi:hypothetical protein